MPFRLLLIVGGSAAAGTLLGEFIDSKILAGSVEGSTRTALKAGATAASAVGVAVLLSKVNA
jgi:hypothetical protein